LGTGNGVEPNLSALWATGKLRVQEIEPGGLETSALPSSCCRLVALGGQNPVYKTINKSSRRGKAWELEFKKKTPGGQVKRFSHRQTTILGQGRVSWGKKKKRRLTSIPTLLPGERP